MLKVATSIERFTRAVGELLKWLLPIIVGIAATVTVLRYGLSVGYPWLSESFVWLNGVLILLAAASVLTQDGHVRVDILYRRHGPVGRAWVDLIGTALFLWPMMLVLAVKAWPGVLRSWRLLEGSPSIDGLPFLYLVKSCILLFCLLMSLQGLASVLRSLDTIVEARRGAT